MARREDVPASGRRENAILPSGHDSSLENAGDAIAVAAVVIVAAVVVNCSIVAAAAAVAVAGERSGIEDAMAVVDIAAKLERNFLLVSLFLLVLIDVDSCSSDSLFSFEANITSRDLLGSFLSAFILPVGLLLVVEILY